MAGKRKQKGKRGPEPSIDEAVVSRVAKLYVHGVPLKYALATEGKEEINLDNWHKALGRKPKLSTLFDAARGRFFEAAFKRIWESKDVKDVWKLLFARSSDEIRMPAEPGSVVNVSQNVGIPEDLLLAARERAIRKSKAKHGK